MRRFLFPLFAAGILAVPTFAETPASVAPRKPSVAVMPLTGQGVDDASSQVVTDALSDELLKTGKVRVMERSQMEKILKEQGFQASGGCDGSECAVEVGKLLSIDKMLVGSLGKLGSSFSISVRVVDVSTGEVVGSSRRMQRGEIDEVVTAMVPNVASDLAFSLTGSKLDSVEVGAPVVVPSPAAVPVPAPVETAPVAEPTALLATEAVAPVVATTSPPTPEPTPQPPSVEPAHRSTWGYWVAGGVLVAGGVTAAVLLTQSKSNDPALVNNDTSWQTTVEWK